MTRRVVLILLTLTVVAVVGVLFGASVYWAVFGWVSREPFWSGRPAEYWAGEVQRLGITASDMNGRGEARPTLYFAESLHPTWMDCLALRVAGVCGRNFFARPNAVEHMRGDVAALEVLADLLGHQDPPVRGYAVGELQALATFHPETVDKVLGLLRPRVADEGKLPRAARWNWWHEQNDPPPTDVGACPQVTVGTLASEAVRTLAGKGVRKEKVSGTY